MPRNLCKASGLSGMGTYLTTATLSSSGLLKSVFGELMPNIGDLAKTEFTRLDGYLYFDPSGLLHDFVKVGIMFCSSTSPYE